MNSARIQASRGPCRTAQALCGSALLALAAGCSGGALGTGPGGTEAAPDGATDPGGDRTDPSAPDGTAPSPLDGQPPSGPDAAGPGGAGGAGPGPDPWSAAPPLRDAIALPDAELAPQALALLGSAAVGAEGSCRNCHSLGRPTLTRWSRLTQEFTTDCLGNSELPDLATLDAMFDCLRARADKPASPFTPAEFGVYAAAAQLPWFAFVFQHASQLPDGASALHDFVSRVGMPRAGRPWTQAEFDIVAEWFARGLPRLYELVPEDSGEDCTPGLDPSLGTYLEHAALAGWRAQNAQVPLLSFGCAADQAGSRCLGNLPRAAAQSYAAGWESLPGTQIRILYDNSQHLTSFWSRCSADGRYIGAGLRDTDDNGFDGQIVDLAQGTTIAGDFAYDATFFPDNSGFLMQQGGYNDGSVGVPTNGGVMPEAMALICMQSVLAGASEISGDDPECTLVGGKFGLYQQTAKSLDGGDYWVVHGSYESDNGGFSATPEDPSAAFDSISTLTLTPFVNQGNGFVVGTSAQVSTPHQGDPMLSPSGGLLVMRLKGREYDTNVDGFDVVAAEQSGYALYGVTQTQGTGASTASLQDLGRICLQGGKATFSYDERWLVFHHYVRPNDAAELGFSGPDDPSFAEYLSRGSSNLYLVDLTSGAAQRITRMQPGQYALFPHFRSDGWIYFDVRTLDGEEWFAASDAALVGEAAQ